MLECNLGVGRRGGRELREIGEFKEDLFYSGLWASSSGSQRRGD